MKKYNSDYFKKKYQILFDKLIKKENFIEEIRNARKELKIPEEGFNNSQELADFCIKKLSKIEKKFITLFAFGALYARRNKKPIIDVTEEEVTEAFNKEKYKDGINEVLLRTEFVDIIESHHNLFSNSFFFERNKYLSDWLPIIKRIMHKYWGVDLLDDHIILHYVEKYLLMGSSGIDHYIRSKVACHNCRYIGVQHFSPERGHMNPKSKGAYSKNYVFNKETVRMLSFYFDSVFIIIKPYATKELVLQYIDDNWDDLKAHLIEKNNFYKQFDVHPSVIRESDDDRNRLVYELYKLSKKELINKYKGEKDLSISGIYKENIISVILDEEYNIKMSSDAVKKTAQRFSKSIKIQQEPKDIRDI